MVKRRRRVSQENTVLLERIQALKAEHPFWGYRRIHAYLKYRDQLPVNHKRIYRLMRDNGLLVRRKKVLRALRTPSKSKPRTVIPNAIWGIDMTKIMIPDYGWAYLHVVLDWGSKKIVGWSLSSHSKTCDWIEALDQALINQFQDGYRQVKTMPMLVSDNGCQPTSKAFKAHTQQIGIEHIFTSYNNPKGNADTERVIRTIKEDLVWINEWNSIEQLKERMSIWIKQYNEEFPHSTLGYQTPYEYERWFNAAAA